MNNWKDKYLESEKQLNSFINICELDDSLIKYSQIFENLDNVKPEEEFSYIQHKLAVYNRKEELYNDMVRRIKFQIEGHYNKKIETEKDWIRAFIKWFFSRDFVYDEGIYDQYTFLKNKKGRCYNFAKLFTDFCRSQGIEGYTIKGYSGEEGAPHRWNKVLIEGRPYYFDFTFALNEDEKDRGKWLWGNENDFLMTHWELYQI